MSSEVRPRSFARIATPAVLGYWALIYFVHIQAVQPWGSASVFWLAFPLLVLTPAVIALAAIVAILGCARRSWLDAAVGLGLALLSLGAIRGFRSVEGYFRCRAVHRAVAGLAPLPRAIRECQRVEGHPPASLEALVPRYLPSIPVTGLGAHTRLEYHTGERVPHGEDWILMIPTPLGFLNWDMLLYLPSGRYPAEGWGGSLERVGDWAYVHE